MSNETIEYDIKVKVDAKTALEQGNGRYVKDGDYLSKRMRSSKDGTPLDLLLDLIKQFGEIYAGPTAIAMMEYRRYMLTNGEHGKSKDQVREYLRENKYEEKEINRIIERIESKFQNNKGEIKQ